VQILEGVLEGIISGIITLGVNAIDRHFARQQQQNALPPHRPRPQRSSSTPARNQHTRPPPRSASAFFSLTPFFRPFILCLFFF